MVDFTTLRQEFDTVLDSDDFELEDTAVFNEASVSLASDAPDEAKIRENLQTLRCLAWGDLWGVINGSLLKIKQGILLDEERKQWFQKIAEQFGIIEQFLEMGKTIEPGLAAKIMTDMVPVRSRLADLMAALTQVKQ